MRVELVQATPNAGRMIADIASICYGKEEAKYPEKLLRHLYEGGHHSTLEHVYYTFRIEGISRACLAQLTRHRHASYTVRSQRYCNEKDAEFVIPESIALNSEAFAKYADTIGDIKNAYSKLIELGIKKEDARFILPEATITDLYMSLNLRELLHIVNLRTHKAAQWEIRELVERMKEIVVSVSPELKFMFEGDMVNED